MKEELKKSTTRIEVPYEYYMPTPYTNGYGKSLVLHKISFQYVVQSNDNYGGHCGRLLGERRALWVKLEG